MYGDLNFKVAAKMYREMCSVKVICCIYLLTLLTNLRIFLSVYHPVQMNEYSRTSIAQTLMARSPGLARTIIWSLQVILDIINPGWVELPLTITNFHGPKPVRAIEVLLYVYDFTDHTCFS